MGVRVGQKRRGGRRGAGALLLAGLLLAGCAASGGPSGIITGEALEPPAVAEAEAVVATPATGVATGVPSYSAGSTTVDVAPIPAGRLRPAPSTAAVPVSEPVAATTPATGPPAAPAASPGYRDSSTSRAAPAPKGREKEAEKPFPNFGTPVQIGDRPVLTTDEATQLQQNLEKLAREREAKAVRELEQDQ